jgi:hypothetical protein
LLKVSIGFFTDRGTARLHCYNEDELRDQLQGLPHDLDEVYDRIISGLNERHREDAFKILQWLSFSARPLELAEVAQVIGVVPDTG